MEKFFNSLSSPKSTFCAGVFLAASFVLFLTKTRIVLDPALATIVICGLPIAREAALALFCQRRISSPLLITIAMVAAVSIGEIFAAAEVAFIMAVGEILEEKTISKARRGIEKLFSLAPDTGRIVVNGADKIVPVSEISIGDTLKVLAGEAIPADGKIIFGSTSIDQSAITGESLPVDKRVGDEVFAGTVNRFGAIEIRAEKVGKDSSIEKLLRLVKQAEQNKSPTQRVADKLASILVPASLFLAVGVYFATGDISRAVTILVVFCPCALVLATPVSVMAAIGQAAKNGVIIKSGAVLEKMGQVEIAAFDKTGTLTRGTLEITDCVPLSDKFSADDILGLCASAESLSEHPIGKAVASFARLKKLKISAPSDFKTVLGRGVEADVDGQKILCGNAEFLTKKNTEVSEEAKRLYTVFGGDGKSVLLVAKDSETIGAIALGDTLKPDTKQILSELSEIGVETFLLTGDNRAAANYFAKQTGMKNTKAELLPEMKLDFIKLLRSGGKTVAMIGDGINDAPALKAADVGVAMASAGSDMAVEAADIALMGDELAKIPYLKRLSNATVRLIKINIALSIAINFAAIALSIAGTLNPVTGALVHNVSSLIVILNAGFLYDRNFLKHTR